jgi:hypothetical protein
MNKKTIFGTVILSAALAVLILFSPMTSNAEVSVSVGIALPPLVFPGPPPLVVIPGSTYVYYPPEAGVDIFFYHGYWYRPYRGYWYRSGGYNGPWRGIAFERVPRAVMGVPPGFRRGPVAYEHVPYRDVRSHWQSWERERHWDRGRNAKTGHRYGDEMGREHGGSGRGYGR